jgi:glutamate 5-kinase
MDKKLQVIKIGSSTILEGDQINYRTIKRISHDVYELKEEHGIKSVLVVSGAIPLGMRELKYKDRPSEKIDLQVCAGVGQKQLMLAYDDGFKGYLTTAEMLFTYDDLRNRRKEKNIETALKAFVAKDIVPLINYNDACDDSEVSYDNDIFASRIAGYAGAKRLILLTNVPGLYDSSGNLVERVEKITKEMREYCKGANLNGVGGMKTKLEACKIATRKGIEVVIGDFNKYSLKELITGKDERTGETILRTLFLPKV